MRPEGGEAYHRNLGSDGGQLVYGTMQNTANFELLSRGIWVSLVYFYEGTECQVKAIQNDQKRRTVSSQRPREVSFERVEKSLFDPCSLSILLSS